MTWPYAYLKSHSSGSGRHHPTGLIRCRLNFGIKRSSKHRATVGISSVRSHAKNCTDASSLSVILLWHHPHYYSTGEVSARVPLVLRLQRPVLMNDQPLVHPFLHHLPVVARFDAEYLTSLLLRPLDAYKPVNVPTIEEELAVFHGLLKSVLSAC